MSLSLTSTACSCVLCLCGSPSSRPLQSSLTGIHIYMAHHLHVVHVCDDIFTSILSRLERLNVLAVFSTTIMLILAGLNQVKHW